MTNTLEILIASDGGGGSVTAAREPAPKPAWDAPCLWCDRTFTPRATGGSAQKFCCTGHRQQFWIAARRWTMRAIEAGLLSVDCLKASRTERARCHRGIPIAETPLLAGAHGVASECVGFRPLRLDG